MKDPLIEIKHISGKSSYVRVSLIRSISDAGEVRTERTTYQHVTNVKDIVRRVNAIK
jgi:hypothetical protein